jgi:hypothetical protein
LHLVLANLRLQRGQLRLGVLMGRFRLFELGLAHSADIEQALHARQLLLAVGEIGFTGGALRFDGRDGRLLAIGVDLNERLPCPHPIARGDQDLADDPFDLRLNRGRPERSDAGDELGRIRNRLRGEGDGLDLCGGNSGLPGHSGVLAGAAGGRKKNDERQWNESGHRERHTRTAPRRRHRAGGARAPTKIRMGRLQTASSELR